MNYRFYTDLAPWWPLISPPADYAEEASMIGSLLAMTQAGGRRVLELGSGGGHNAVHLKDRFDLTLVDLSADMLQQSRALNPECEHVVGDMRSVRLGRQFDAVYVHDAIDYMIDRPSLYEAIVTAYEHCLPGGIAVFIPDYTRETFVAATEHGGSDAADGRAARYLDWTWDPDPSGEQLRAEFAFVLRDADGGVESVFESHTFGVFHRATWLNALADCGFEPIQLREQPDDDRTPRDIFLGRRD